MTQITTSPDEIFYFLIKRFNDLEKKLDDVRGDVAKLKTKILRIETENSCTIESDVKTPDRNRWQ